MLSTPVIVPGSRAWGLFAAGCALALFSGCNAASDRADAAEDGAAPPNGVAASGETTPRISTPVPTSRPRGQLAPDFSLTLLDGTSVQLSDLKGQVVLIDFWATWCGPCRMAIPHLVELQNEHAEAGFTILGVSLDRGGPDVVTRFVEKAGINYPVGMGSQGLVRAYGGVQSIPMAFLVDRDGYVAKVLRGYRPKAAMEQEILPLIAEGETG